MVREQRGANRVVEDLTVRLFLRAGPEGPVLAGPTDCTLANISSTGAGLKIPKIFIDNHHLFYSPRDTPELFLYLKFTLFGDDDKNLPIPVRPIWFDRTQSPDGVFFNMGVEFLLTHADDEVKRMIRVVSQKQKGSMNWLSNLLGKIKSQREK